MCEGSSGTRRGRRWDFLKDFLVRGQNPCDLACHLVFPAGELLDGLSYSGELLLHRLSYRGNVRLHLLHLLQVDRGGSGLFWCERLWRDLRNLRRLRRLRHRRTNSVFLTSLRLRPAKLLDPARDHLLGLWRPAEVRRPRRDYPPICRAVRLPSQGGGNTNTKCNQVGDESLSRSSPLHLAFHRFFRQERYFLEAVIDCLSFRSLVAERQRQAPPLLIPRLFRLHLRCIDSIVRLSKVATCRCLVMAQSGHHDRASYPQRYAVLGISARFTKRSPPPPHLPSARPPPSLRRLVPANSICCAVGDARIIPHTSTQQEFNTAD